MMATSLVIRGGYDCPHVLENYILCLVTEGSLFTFYGVQENDYTQVYAGTVAFWAYFRFYV